MAVTGRGEFGWNLLVYGGDTEPERGHPGGDDAPQVGVDTVRGAREANPRGQEEFAADEVGRGVLDLRGADRADTAVLGRSGDLAQAQFRIGQQHAEGNGRLLGLGHEEASSQPGGTARECRFYPTDDSILDGTRTSATRRPVATVV